MTDTTEAQDEEQEQTQEAEQEQEQQQAEPTPAEAKATKAGWRPKEDWADGGTGTWMDAEQFNERNERLANRGDKILKAEIASLKRQQATDQRAHTQSLTEIKDHLTKADARAYKKALKDLETKADKAVEEGDTDAYHRAKGEIKELAQEVKPEVKTETKAAPTQQDDPAYDDWLTGNAWYDPQDEEFDVEMASYADSIVQQTARTGLGGKALYERMTTEIKKKFPDRFGNQRRREAPRVEGAGTGGGGNGKTLWSQVPKGARAEFKRFVGQGLYKDNKEGQEEYADIYVNG